MSRENTFDLQGGGPNGSIHLYRPEVMSFYASVEAVDRGLDPLATNLVVADESRGDGTICLAVSPSLKALKISGRARLFEVKQRLEQIKRLTGKQIDFIIATPRMQRYLDVSAEIYGVYLMEMQTPVFRDLLCSI